MEIVVCVKEVPATMEEIGLTDDGSIDDEYATYGMNAADEYALEEAAQLVEEHGGTVTVMTIDDADSEETIQTAIAKGADEAVRIWDEDLDGSDSVAKARLLADRIESMDTDPDLVFTGLQSDDSANAQVGGALASELDLPYASLVVDLEYEPGDDEAVVGRELEGGTEERMTIDVPAVMSIWNGINSPRYASIREIRQAQQTEIELVDLESIDVPADEVGSAGAWTSLENRTEPETDETADLFEGDASETAAELAEQLNDDGIIQ